MNSIVNIVILIWVMFFLSIFVAVGFAQGGRVSIAASNVIEPSVMIRVIRQAGEIVVSEKEIAQGYVLVEDATIVEIDSKYMKSFALSFELTGDTFRTVWAVDQNRKEIQIGKMGIFNYPNRRERTVDLKKLSFKLYLSDNVEPGEYPWPVRLNIIL